MSFGIKNVVGGFDSSVTEEKLIPYTLARTFLEHRQLRRVINTFCKEQVIAVEFGCGYGRNLELLFEDFIYVFGLERDLELKKLANKLSPVSLVYQSDLMSSEIKEHSADLVLSYTVLQHVPDRDLEKVCSEMLRVVRPEGKLILVESSHMEDAHEEGGMHGHGCFPRTPARYAELLGDIVHLEPRIYTIGGAAESGTLIVLRPRSKT